MFVDTISERNFRELCKRLSECYLLIGAGISRQAGLPSWETLVEQFEEDFAFPREASEDFIFYFQRVKNRYHKEFFRKLDEALNYEEIHPSETHGAIVKLPVKNIYFTTNIDYLLEQTFWKNSMAFNKIYSDEELQYLNENKRTIIKLHGCLDCKKSIVFAREDYSYFDLSAGKMASFFCQCLEFHPFLFLGFSFRDFNIMKFLDRTRQSRENSFTIVSGWNANQIEEINNNKIWPINLVSYDNLCSCILKLSEKASLKNKSALKNYFKKIKNPSHRDFIVNFAESDQKQVSVEDIKQKYGVGIGSMQQFLQGLEEIGIGKLTNDIFQFNEKFIDALGDWENGKLKTYESRIRFIKELLQS